ncbi:MAG: helix-turn-helix transcriptional regulator [Clostridia bacterium]|nr:helix-turn-helix transcriptional regulator [Clostridia bacterium]
MNFNLIGQKIAEARIKNNKTQESLAEELNISPAFLSNIETAKRRPSLSTLILIAEKLNLSLDYLIYDKDIKIEINNDIYIKQLFKQLERLDENKKQKFLDIMDYIAKKL